MELRFPGGKILRLLTGDITKVPSGAIVNAANSGLRGGGGVDGAIHRAGGPSLMKELDVIRAEQGGCPTGSAVATSAGSLPADFVFHAVGPIWRGGHSGEEELLAACYSTSLRMAEERKIKIVTFPSISTGVYGYPVDLAAPVALRTVVGHLKEDQTAVREAVFVLFDKVTFDAYSRALAAL